MSVIVKIMGGEDAPDSDTRHTYKLFTDVVKTEFVREGDEAHVWLWFREDHRVGEVYASGVSEPERFMLDGNVYIMNNDGKTISSFGPAPIPGVEVPPAQDMDKGTEQNSANVELTRACAREADARATLILAQAQESEAHAHLMLHQAKELEAKGYTIDASAHAKKGPLFCAVKLDGEEKVVAGGTYENGLALREELGLEHNAPLVQWIYDSRDHKPKWEEVNANAPFTVTNGIVFATKKLNPVGAALRTVAATAKVQRGKTAKARAFGDMPVERAVGVAPLPKFDRRAKGNAQV